MIHNLSALPVGHALGVKSAKGGAEAAILALFGKALAAQLQAADKVVTAAEPAAASLPPVASLSDALGMTSGEMPAQTGDGAAESTNPAEILAAEVVAEPAQLSGLVSPLAAVTQSPTAPALPGASMPDEVDPTEGAVPAATKNPLVLTGQKNLPVTPAGFAANEHAFKSGWDQDLPAGIQMKAGLSDGLDMKATLPGLEAGSRMPLLSAVEGLVDVARPASTPSAFSALPVQAQGEVVGLSSGASRQVTQLVTPFTQPQWQSELGEKVVWLAGRQGQMAELSLNPPSLGGIEVRLNMSGQEAGAQFFSANPAVREAIEAALPRLREMLAEAGLSLGQATVSSEPFRDRDASTQQAEGKRDEEERAGVLSLGNATGGARSRSGLVDLYV